MEVLSFCPNLLIKHLMSRVDADEVLETSKSTFHAACMLVDISGFSSFSGSMCSKVGTKTDRLTTPSHPLDTPTRHPPSQHTLSTHPLDAPSRHTLSPSRHTLLTHTLSSFSGSMCSKVGRLAPTLSTHPLDTPFQHTLSTQPLDTPC